MLVLQICLKILDLYTSERKFLAYKIAFVEVITVPRLIITSSPKKTGFYVLVVDHVQGF